MDSPFLRQLFVASSPQLAALSVGGVTGFSNVILEQLKSNDSTIPVDFHEATWIGSVHGPAGLLSIVMPLIMQRTGRKFTYIASCLIIILGWILMYLANNITTIIVGECFHGFGINSIIDVSFSTISEMVDPRYRTISLSFYVINQTLGVSFAGIIGRYLHWKTVSLIMCTPVTVALIIGCMWPESPAWLAYKGEYVKCEQAFKWLRGTDENSQKELKELLSARKENSISSKKAKFKFHDVWIQITSRDFYVPSFHIVMTLSPFYFGGFLVIITYGIEIMQTVSNSLSAARYGMIATHIVAYLACITSVILLKFLRNKTLFLISGLSSAFLMFGCAAGSLLQSVGILPSTSLMIVYLLVLFMLFASLGVTTLSFAVSGELMPVKHRGLGGIVYIVIASFLHTITLKISPFLFLYIGEWRTFLLFGIMKVASMVYIWRCVPETKGKTLQHIEDIYNNGRLIARNYEESECIDERFIENICY